MATATKPRKRRKAKQGGPVKAELIREALTVLGPEARPRDVIQHVHEAASVDVNHAQVSGVKAAISRKANGQSVTLSDLTHVKALSDSLGSVERVREAVNAFESLTRKPR